MRKTTPQDLIVRPFTVLDQQWALLVAGSEHPNPMTVSWGGLGTLWDRPVATVYVRPSRFTFSLLEGEPFFTLNFLSEPYRSALDLCGSTSGRDTDKWRATSLSRVPGMNVPVPHVAEAELVLECRVLATLDIDPKRFLEPAIQDLYPKKDYHRVFLGEVLTVFADERYLPQND
ncbi:MAG TPA: flavin reductase family protein [Thermoanaerobaculaceae bacterium]|nr:flavin reductase family protein [Thermoanaerobaculaceae bacterium]